MSGALEFRRLAEGDLPTLFTWLGRPHVAKWYGNAPSSFAEVVARYGGRTEPGHPVSAYIVTRDGRDVGYVQCYPVALFPEYAAELGTEPGVAGMDVLIGESWLLGRGLGSQVIRAFARDIVFADARVPACVAGPEEGDAAGVRAFEKAGFRRWKVAKAEGGRTECVMRRERVDGDPAAAPEPLAG